MKVRGAIKWLIFLGGCLSSGAVAAQSAYVKIAGQIEAEAKDGGALPVFHLDVYTVSPAGKRTLERTGRIIGAQFYTYLKVGQAHELIVQMEGYEPLTIALTADQTRQAVDTPLMLSPGLQPVSGAPQAAPLAFGPQGPAIESRKLPGKAPEKWEEPSPQPMQLVFEESFEPFDTLLSAPPTFLDTILFVEGEEMPLLEEPPPVPLQITMGEEPFQPLDEQVEESQLRAEPALAPLAIQQYWNITAADLPPTPRMSRAQEPTILVRGLDEAGLKAVLKRLEPGSALEILEYTTAEWWMVAVGEDLIGWAPAAALE